jgi:hypothetical protein
MGVVILTCTQYVFFRNSSCLLSFPSHWHWQAAYMLILGYVGGILALMAVVVYGKKKKVNISALGVGMDFMQVGHG